MRLLTLCGLEVTKIEEVVPALEYVLEPTYSAQCKRREGRLSILSREIDKRLNLPS